MMLLLCGLLWLSAVAVQADELDCNDRMDVTNATEWPALRGFKQEVLNRTKLVSVGVISIGGAWVPHAVLHTTDKRTYLRGKANSLHLYPCRGNAVTREIVEMRGLAVKDIRFGYNFIVILTEEGSVWTSGGNSYNSLGQRGTTSTKLFAPVEGLPKVKQIAVGDGYHCVALTYSTQLFSWGYGSYYRLGYSASSSNSGPRAIPMTTALSTPKYVCCGTYSCAALMENNRVVTWGLGGYNGRSSSHAVPGYVNGISSTIYISQISCGYLHTLAVSSTGILYGWGDNANGELLQATRRATSATVLNLGGKLVRGAVAGKHITVVKTFSEEPEYFGMFDGHPRSTARQGCDAMKPRDLLARSINGQESWGAVRLGCGAEDDAEELANINEKSGTLTIGRHGEITMQATNMGRPA